MSFPTYTFIEVCAGAGGLSSGFIEAGLHPILLNEIDAKCSETLRKNHPNVLIRCEDMQRLHLHEYKDKVDVLMGGVPCQAFSQAGQRKGLEDPRGKLMLEMNRLILECAPKIMLIENVKGLLSHQSGKTLQSLLELFSNNGMYQMTYKLLNASHYSVPQKRERVFIVGVRQIPSQIMRPFSFPEPHTKRLVLRDVLINVPESGGVSYPEAKRRILEMVPAGGCWVDLPPELQIEYMGASMQSGGGKRGMARRLSMDEPCLTLTTSPCQKQTERCHPFETRPLTVREYARIQTFPDTYQFAGGITCQYKQIGNAVPVQLAKAVAEAIRRYLDEIYPLYSLYSL